MWLLLSLAQAGDPGPLCPAVADADAIVEVSLSARGAWPPGYRERQWQPDPATLAPTVATARPGRKLKGDPQGWKPALEDLPFSNQSVQWWDRFFAAGDFQALVMLDRDSEGQWRSTGYLADEGSCSVSWCWEPLRGAVQACLASPARPAP
jgi:hypothetical protein